MKKNKIAWLRFMMSFSLILTVFVSSSMVALAVTDKKSLAGEITVLGSSGSVENPSVLLNGERAFSGQTFFSSGRISTSETSSATISLGKLGHINLSPNSILNLNFTENNISGKLSAGQIKVFAKEGVLVNIQTVDGTVNNDAKLNSVYTIDVQSGTTQTSAEQGSVSLLNEPTNIPAQSGKQTTGGGNSYLVPLLIFTGVVAATAIYVLTRGDDEDNASPVR